LILQSVAISLKVGKLDCYGNFLPRAHDHLYERLIPMPIVDPHRALTISRRRFLGSGALTAVAAPTLTYWNSAQVSAAEAATAFNPSADFLQSAIDAAQWIQSAQRQDTRGTYWLPEPDHPDKLTTISPPNTLYSGSAGTVLFFIELAGASGNAE
jgi:hypothetical protein